MRILITADPEVLVPPAGDGGIEHIVNALVHACRALDGKPLRPQP